MRNTCRLLIPLRHTTYCRYLKIKQWLGLNSQNVNTSYWSRPCCISLHSDSANIVAQTNTNGSSKRRLVLGIETSCDDTGAAVVDDRGIVVGDALNSQTKTHVAMGGIIPPIARDLHKENIEPVVSAALEKANVTLNDLNAVAVTVKPGLSLSLLVGLQYAKQLVKKTGVDFPFLVLLISGGHCLLAVARGISDFLLLGHGLDDSPGEAFDKTARQLKLKNLPQCQELSGGAAIELLARDGNPKKFAFPQVMTRIPDCNFSFAGIKFNAKKLIEAEETKLQISASAVLPNAPDICASFQYAVLYHLARRLQRAFLFCELRGFLPKQKTLVLSGGVASNQYIREGLQQICEKFSCQLVCPPPHLCTDNGIMIAWNGMEKLLQNTGQVHDVDALDIQPKCPFGVDISQELKDASIKLPQLKLH
ncbi:probable tRNA N6-adenosine threonylcarbamoyltransferase, mitochondrial isoform X2 [Pomacea canaliculata]|uniref:probable tRNA N6-adenosine threonylcarbamoyltransferase, mitochondrial isoform X2 n=1 Tax=Pomacea canaliculata TaxID=400727 RepID=UPI000D73F131|nr:probable tRNA N6-adenosine threonylcarbamoyltransferase, mitochondrial isoform X2 [Pomacea canaliculata]